jgi:hypothetical protein
MSSGDPFYNPAAAAYTQQPWYTDSSSFAQGAPMQASSFVPVAAAPLSSTAADNRLTSFEDEPPLLVELGINFSSIARKTLSALHPTSTLDPSLMADGDLAGPLVFCLVMGFFLMLTGKLHFGYVFGFAVSGSVGLWLVLNLMTPQPEGIRLHVVVSVLGYGLLPIVALAGISVVHNLGKGGAAGYMLVPAAVAWCTLTATRFFEAALSAREQRYLIAYPSFLLYACFALIAVF